MATKNPNHDLQQTNGTFQFRGIVTGTAKDGFYKEITTKSNKPMRMVNFGVEYDKDKRSFISLNGMVKDKVHFSKQTEKDGKKTTDVKPVECLIFMRDVRSKNYFEQMKGRGTRTLVVDDLQKVTPSATENKDHFVIVDAVGVTKSKKSDTRPLERKPSVSMKELMMNVALGAKDEDTLTSLASRITRLNAQMTSSERKTFENTVGIPASKVAENLLNAFDEDVQRSLQAGMNAHLTKPIDNNTLYSTLETLIQDNPDVS